MKQETGKGDADNSSYAEYTRAQALTLLGIED